MPDLEAARPSQPRGRPFPWHCPRCRRKEVRPATIPYRGVRTYEGREFAVDVPELVVPRCGNCGELVFNYTAEEQIDQALKALAGTGGADQNGGAMGSVPPHAPQDSGPVNLPEEVS